MTEKKLFNNSFILQDGEKCSPAYKKASRKQRNSFYGNYTLLNSSLLLILSLYFLRLDLRN